MSAKGFTLLEICASLVVIGLASVASMDVMHMLSVSVAVDNQHAVTTDLLDAITESFSSNEETCTKNLGGLPFDPTAPGGVRVTQLDHYDLNGARQRPIATIDGTLGNSGLIVQDMRVLPVALLDPNTIVAKLEISLRRNGPSGSINSMVRELPIFVSLNAGRIFYCSPSSSNKFTVNNKLCELLADGYAYYDIINDVCADDPRVTWVTSPDNITASCPAGFKLAGSSMDPAAVDVVCYRNTAGVPVTPRRYTNGFQSSGLSYRVTVTADFPANACRFVYGPGENLAIAISQAKCVPQAARPL